ncbi:MAG TPA: NAD(P)-binding protein, partial [Dehalococcoidia bacterium]|nr:NAD(P)-binding protein [Dehalococcoidia bacterium]
MPKLEPNRVPLPHRDPHLRAQDFQEVAEGFSSEAVREEASRCLVCPKPRCVPGCPAGIDIPGFIKAIQEEDMPRAVRVLKEKNSLPGVCGRVCPQETQCEVRCVVGKRGQPLAIGGLERFVADWQRRERYPDAPLEARPSGKKVAVVGSGPAGLTCAADLARAGHQVSI